MRLMLLGGCLALAACDGQAWRAGAASRAEEQVRQVVSDPSAQFSRVQVTGDDRTGQTCGFASVRTPDGLGHLVRFIVYIDASAGPYVEAGLGRQVLTQDNFERAWQADCVKEGYDS
ncbi:MAG: hypothetical protein P4L73_06065 [Caulobacteraceae bacterium]|nr:hypothetical protein [Caulobacteraceae bacterium]